MVAERNSPIAHLKPFKSTHEIPLQGIVHGGESCLRQCSASLNLNPASAQRRNEAEGAQSTQSSANITVDKQNHNS
jgi:hypothetical protein